MMSFNGFKAFLSRPLSVPVEVQRSIGIIFSLLTDSHFSTMMRFFVVGLILLSQTSLVTAWSNSKPNKKAVISSIHPENYFSTTNRRRFLLVGASFFLPSSHANAAATRAVGSGEIECRQAGNCLEKGEWDGAVGWNWGGKDRCDATDPRCGPDGQYRETDLVGKPVPDNLAQITHAVVLRIDVGREESGILKLGLYGKDCPGSVQQLVEFLSDGLVTMSPNDSDRLGATQVPLSLSRGGVVSDIVPGLTVDFGVLSQANAYARSRGMSKAGDFVPQPRPKPNAVAQDGTIRQHDAAGLVSVPVKGLGYGGTGFEQDDEAFESSFLITNDKVPALDKTRRVVGQVLDSKSMAFLERLVSLPTKRGIRGVIPGQTSGPPLLKTVVRDTKVSTVSDPGTSSS